VLKTPAEPLIAEELRPVPIFPIPPTTNITPAAQTTQLTAAVAHAAEVAGGAR
jgi:hypothetical protein